MSGMERVREFVTTGTADDVIRRRSEAGWRLVALEWERQNTGSAEESQFEPVPYGLRVAPDCQHLEPDPQELEVLTQVAQMIVQERRLPEIADSLNQKGHRTRSGGPWTPSRVFELMPSLIDRSPRIFAKPEWPERRRASVAL